MPYYTIKNAFFYGMGFPFSPAIEAEGSVVFRQHTIKRTQLLETLELDFHFF